MNEPDTDWLLTGEGVSPRFRWSFAVDAPLVSLERGRETGEVLAADASGGLYLLDRCGRVVMLTRGFSDLEEVAWSDMGHGGVAVTDETTLIRLSRRLEVQWSLELPEAILGIAIDSYGHYIAAGLADGTVWIYDVRKRVISQFETIRPLSFLRFLVSEPQLLCAAEYGLVCCHDLDGNELWSARPLSNVGDLSITGDGSTSLLACFGHGIQIYTAEGAAQSSLVVGGTPHRASISFVPKRIAVATLERHLYWLDSVGDLLWAATLPSDVCALRCEPAGNGLIIGLNSGRIVSIDWETPLDN
jgi:hypothetical protein